MGTTSPVSERSRPQGLRQPDHNPSTGIEDVDGEDVEKFTNFMAFLGAPARSDRPQQRRDRLRGGRVASCHNPAFQTGANPVAALNRVTFTVLDFLLHDMGSRRRHRAGAVHGRDAHSTPGAYGPDRNCSTTGARRRWTGDLAHDGQGRNARDAYVKLDATAKSRLIAFLEVALTISFRTGRLLMREEAAFASPSLPKRRSPELPADDLGHED
jgi:CxxC motif-containing protein (DUF1111 family)